MEKWSLDHLAEAYGDERVRYQQGRSEGAFFNSFSDHGVEASLGDYIDLIRREEVTDDYYLIAHDRLLDRPGFRGLIDDMYFDPRYFNADDTEGRLFFWLGPGGSMTHMHRDLGNVFFAQLRGRKQVKMLPAKQMHYVYNETSYYSEVNFDQLSLEEYPLLEQAFLIEDVIEPGELLFLPVGWWHFFKSLQVTISVTMTNFRWNNDLPRLFE